MPINFRPLVSVIIPTYNRATTIIKAVNSVLEQTYKNIELIVVDDCSTDNTLELLKEINDSRLSLYRLEKNSGACFARNYGFEKSNGSIIALHDSDDYWHPNKLEKQIFFLLSNPYDFVFCGMRRIMPTGELFYFPLSTFDCSNNFIENELAENVISTQTMVMKRAVFEKIKFDVSFKRFQDWDFAIRVAKDFKIGDLKEALVDSVVQKNSITLTISEYEALLKLYSKYKEDIETNRTVYFSLQCKLGDSIRKIDPRKAKKHFRNALHKKTNFKILVKYIMSALKIKY